MLTIRANCGSQGRYRNRWTTSTIMAERHGAENAMRSNLKDSHIASENLKTRSRKIYRAAFETLEPRFLLATDLVTSLADSGAGSLRQTLATAAANDTIQFASTLSGGSIKLTSGPLTITHSVSIVGLGVGNL